MLLHNNKLPIAQRKYAQPDFEYFIKAKCLDKNTLTLLKERNPRMDHEQIFNGTNFNMEKPIAK